MPIGQSVSEYVENVRYFYDPLSLIELQKVLKGIYLSARTEPSDLSDSLFSIFDKNIRQLLKNLLVFRSGVQQITEFQAALVLFETIIGRSENEALKRKYLERCTFASEAAGDRINELMADQSKLISRPQVKTVLTLIARNKTMKQKQLQEALDVSKQRASNLLRQMRSAALIDATHAYSDKREVSYSLTGSGRAACSELGFNRIDPVTTV